MLIDFVLRKSAFDSHHIIPPRLHDLLGNCALCQQRIHGYHPPRQHHLTEQL
jgi:hypothetical protein